MLVHRLHHDAEAADPSQVLLTPYDARGALHAGERVRSAGVLGDERSLVAALPAQRAVAAEPLVDQVHQVGGRLVHHPGGADHGRPCHPVQRTGVSGQDAEAFLGGSPPHDAGVHPQLLGGLHQGLF